MATTTAQAVAAGWVFAHPQTTCNGGQSPTVTLTVFSTASFPSAGSAWVKETKFNYTGKTGTTFTGCTGLPGTVAANDLVLIDGLSVYRAEHLLDGRQVSQAAVDVPTVLSGIDGFKAHNASGNSRGEKWHGETI